MDTRQLLYVSRATSHVTPDDAAHIAAISRRNNYRQAITGCLLFTGRSFAQVLEGRPDDVEALCKRLTDDHRHTDVRILLDRVVPTRFYSRWSMAYVMSLDLADEVESLLVRDATERDVELLFAEMKVDTIVGEL